MRRSPQEDKALSYAKDRRYAYGNSNKAARKAVPRRKRWVNKANRHAEQQVLAEARGMVDATRAEDVEQRLRGRQPKRWRKWPDRPLGKVLERRRQRAQRDMPLRTLLPAGDLGSPDGREHLVQVVAVLGLAVFLGFHCPAREHRV